MDPCFEKSGSQSFGGCSFGTDEQPLEIIIHRCECVLDGIGKNGMVRNYIDQLTGKCRQAAGDFSFGTDPDELVV